MRVLTDDGRELRIGRRWLPWRPRARDFDGTGDFFGGLGSDDLVGFALSIVLAVVLALLAPLLLVVLVLSGEWLVVLALIPLAALLRVLLDRPWVVEVRERGVLLHLEKVRGWRASGERIRELANDPDVMRNGGHRDRTV